MRHLILLACACMLAHCFLAEAKTVYVDCQMEDYTGHDGTSWETAVKTLMDGVSKCSSGDTLKVAKGVYDEGYGKFNNDWGMARLELVNKTLNVIGVDGPEQTFIKGEKLTLTDNGDGSITTNYVRCVQNYGSGGSVIEGFTLINGDTGLDPNRNHNSMGGAVCTDNQLTWLVNCVITDCNAYLELCMYTKLVHCIVTNNHLVTTCHSPRIVTYGAAYNSLFYNNSCPKNGDMILKGSGYDTIVNSTFINNRFTTSCTSGHLLYNSICAASGTAGATTKVGCSEGDTDFAIMGSVNGDIRVRQGSAAATAGEATYRSSTYFPFDGNGWISEDYRTKDIRNHTVPTAGTIMAGCLQESAVQKTRPIYFNMNNFNVSVDGSPYAVNQKTHVICDSYPTQLVLRVKTSGTQRPVSFYCSNSAIARLGTFFAEPNDDFHFVPAAASDVSVYHENSSGNIGNVVYTDPKLDDYSEADGTEEHPYETLQDAFDNTSGNIVILAKSGVYNKGGVLNAYQAPAFSNYRLFVTNRAARIIGVDGPENTIIMGAPDPDTLTAEDLPGVGTNGIKCVGTRDAVLSLQGFTLTGGYSSRSSAGTSGYSNYGAAILSVDSPVEVYNCIVTNNWAENYSAAHYAQFRRCLIRDNHSRTHVLNAANMSACIVGPNAMSNVDDGYYLTGGDARAVNCTFIGNGNEYLISTGIPLFNCVMENSLWGNFTVCAGSVCWNIKGFSGAATGYVYASPLLCETASGPGVLFKGSPALTAGTSITNDPAGTAYWFTKSDYDGNRIDPAKPVQFAGARTATLDSGIYVAMTNGIAGAVLGLNEIGSGGTLTIEPVLYSRPVVAAVVNGVTNYFQDAQNHALTFDYAAAVDGVAISDVITANDWYVDAVNGNDSNYGYFPGWAKRTLAAVFTNANVVANDRVIALPGTYEDGLMEQAGFGTRTVRSRAVIPSNVTLESRDGAATTIIKGRAGDSEDPLYYEGMTTMYGIGPGAVRCAFMNYGATLRGFTLKDGHTRANKDNDYYSGLHNDAEFNGGGVIGSGGADNIHVENCVFDGCAAFRGGGAKFARCVNCEFKNCASIYGGGGASDSQFIGCLTHDNVCHSLSYRSGFFYGKYVVNCTICDGLSEFSTEANANTISNSLFLGLFNPFNTSSFDMSNFRNCLFNADKASTVGATSWDNLHETTKRVPGSQLQLDANYRPVLGANIAVDAGSAEFTPAEILNAPDQKNGQRIYNAQIDIGALEADWRPVYAADIRSRKCAVSSASAAVVETDDNTVKLPVGSEVAATLTSAGGTLFDYVVNARVTGTGTLTVTLNGETLGTQAGAGTKEFKFKNALAANDLVFSYAGDDGYAEILNARINFGMLVLMR